MKVTNGAPQRGDDNQPLTRTEMEACRQFKASQMNGHVLFHPRVASGDPMPDCLVFVEKTWRFGVMFLTGVYSVEDGQWYHRENDGDAPAPLGDYDPLEEAWQRAMAAKAELRKKLDIGAFFIPVVVFADMEPDDDIMDEFQGRGARLLGGRDDLPQRMLQLPTADDLHPRLNGRFIAQEMAVLNCGPAPAEPAAEQLSLGLPDAGPLVLQRVDTVNIHVTVVAPAGDDEPPLMTVQVQ